MTTNNANVWNPKTILSVNADSKRIEEGFTAIANQTLFTITTFTYAVGTGSLEVYYENASGDLIYLEEGVDFVEGTTSTFSLIVPATVNRRVVAVGQVGITGTVDPRDTDIYVANYQAVRDYTGTETVLVSAGRSVIGDIKDMMLVKVTGAAPGTYVDDNYSVILPTGGNGSIAWLTTAYRDISIRQIGTLAATAASTLIKLGDVFKTVDRSGAIWEVFLLSSGAANTSYRIAWGENTGAATDLVLVLRLEGKVSLKKFGGLTDGTDNAAVINASLTAIGYVWLENDTNDTVTYVCDSMLTLGNEQIIYIDRDTILREEAGTSDPVVWCKGERSGILGTFFSSSRVIKDTAASVATVVVGVIDYAVQVNSSDRCQISRVRIGGAAIQGATSGTPYSALAVWNPQLTYDTEVRTSYFHQINDIMLENCNYGMHLRGNANASQISNIHLYRTGDRTVLAGAGIYIQGAIENQISKVFHHDSPNTDSLYMTDNCRFNVITGFVCETDSGGSSSRGLVTDDTGANNFIQLHDNVSGGNSVGATFKTANTVMLPKSLTLEDIETVDITSTNATATTTTTDLLAFTGASAVLAKNDITGNITFTVSGLRGVAGSLYYRTSFLLIATGTETDNTNSFSIVTSGAVRGLATYNTLTATDIVGTASLAIANDTTSGFDLVITVPNAACISNATLLMVGNGSAATIIA